METEEGKAPFAVRTQNVLLLLLLIIVVPMILVQARIYQRRFHSRVAREIAANDALSQGIANTFNAYVADVGRQELAIGQAMTLIEPFDVQQAQAYLQRVAGEYTAVRAFHWVGPDGRVAASSDPTAFGVWVEHRDYFQRASRYGLWIISDLFRNFLGPEPFFVIARGVFNHEGILQGVTVAVLLPSKLHETVFQRLPQDAFFELRDTQGTVVCMRPQVDLTWSDRKASAFVHHFSSLNRNNAAEAASDDSFIASHAEVAGMGWTVTVGRPAAAVTAPVWQALRADIMLNLAAVAVSLILALIISRAITSTIKNIRQHVAALEQGDLDHRVQSSCIVELQDLAAAANRLAARRKEVEEAQQRLTAILEATPDIVATATPSEQLLYLNNAGKHLLQLPADTDPMDYVIQNLYPEWAYRIIKEQGIPDAIEHGIWSGETAFKRTDGTELSVSQVILAHRMPDGSLQYLSTLARDISAQKLVQEQLELTVAELKRSNNDLEQYAYVASHDLREPLRTIGRSLGLVQSRYSLELNPEAQEFIGYAVDGAVRMQALIDDLLKYSRIGRGEKQFATVDLNKVLEEVLRNLSLTVEETGAVIEHECLPVIAADHSMMLQLFQNLISNALKFIQNERPQIEIQAEHSSNNAKVNAQDGATGWLLSIHDNGIGIDPSQAERIFMIFQRLHRQDEYNGTGIGLAVCLKIVEYHQGRIWFDSQPGAGTTFYIYLPDLAAT